MTRREKLYVIVNNHFDPTWRRCWNRRFTWGARRFASYAEIQDWYMTDNLALARRHGDYKFEAESTIVARQYVRRHPRALAELRRLAAAGRFAVTGAGDNVIDGNMVLGESLVRNFLTGLLWVERHLGRSTALGIRNDAFGNSAQIPQIFRGCEIAHVTGISYSPVRGRYWRGLDGSTVCTAALPVAARGGDWLKYAPCPTCAGRGCRACRGRGVDLSHLSNLPGPIDETKLAEYGAAQVRVAPEELLPNPALIGWARRMRRRYDVRFALDEELAAHLRKWLDRVDDPPPEQVHPSREANPNNSGCWVTRIRTKQTCRRQEYALLAAEAMAAMAWSAGATWPRRDLAEAWEKLLFTMFHDAITATHVDAAYAELQNTWAAIDAKTEKVRTLALRRFVRPKRGAVSAINAAAGAATTQLVRVELPGRWTGAKVTAPRGKPTSAVACAPGTSGRTAIEFVARDVPPLGAAVYRIARAKAPRVRTLRRPVIRNERFRVEADEHGIVRIGDLKLKADIAAAGTYRPNELVLEHDEGSPWATLQADRHRIALADRTRLVAAEATDTWQRLIFECDPRERRLGTLFGMKARMRIVLHRGIERVDFATEVDWDAFNYRLRMALPVPRAGRGIYGIPYGQLERRAYEPTFGWSAANGDWPAVNWAGVQAPGLSVALLNRGLPSYAIERGERGGAQPRRHDASPSRRSRRGLILLSLLRCPTVPTFLHEPNAYTMTGWDGMRDAGRHRFEYALTAYGRPFADSSVVSDAEGYNAGLLAVAGDARLPEPPRVESDHVRLAAVKHAENGDALVLRLWEYRGRRGPADVVLPPSLRARSAAKVNLLERRGRTLPIAAGRLSVPLRPWEIATLRLELRHT